MADIGFGEHSKKILNFVLKTGLKHLKLEEKVVEENLEIHPNKMVRYLNLRLLNTAKKIKPRWQRWMLRRYGQLILWIAVKDTAYRDAVFYTLYEILKDADKLKPLIKPYVKDPEDWTPNVWHDSKQKTKKLVKDGKLPRNYKSPEESIFVKKIQQQRAAELLKRK